MTLVGRTRELQRLDELAVQHSSVTLVGLPGMGKRALSKAFLELHPDWSSRDQKLGSRSLTRRSQPEGADSVVFRLGPMDSEAARDYLAERIHRMNADVSCDEAALDALVYRVGAIPAGLDLAAGLAASQTVTALLGRLDRRPLLDLASRSPQAMEWRAELDRTLDSLDQAELQVLIELSVFRDFFDDESASQVAVSSTKGALSALAQLHLLEVKEGSFRVVAPIRGLALERLNAHRCAPSVRAQHQRWATEQGADPRRARQVAGELREAVTSDDIALARLACARLATAMSDSAPLRPLLDQLLRLDQQADEMEPEVECAIARLRLVLGEPASTWRRVEPLLGHAGAFEGRARHLAANALRRLGRPEEASSHYARAIAEFEHLDIHHELGGVLANYGGFLVELGRAQDARRAWSRALRCFASIGDERLEAMTVGDLGLLDHEAGRLQDAERRYARALALHSQHNNRRFVGIVSGDLGELKLLMGSPLEAKALLTRALHELSAVGDQRQVIVVGAVLALAESLTGNGAEAKKRFDALRDHAPEDLSSVMAIIAAGLRLDEARHARSAGQRQQEQELLVQIEETLGLPQSPDEARRAAQILRAELDRHRRSAGWAVANDASFVVVPGADEEVRVDLSRQPLKRRLLSALLEARLAQPGSALSQEALLRAGWPGQRSTQSAARNRLHVALSGLRKLGLGELLLSGPKGYMLDPSVELFVAE